MTKLSTIDGHLIWVDCGCGHHASLWVADLLVKLLPTTTVAQVAAAAQWGEHMAVTLHLRYQLVR